MKAINVARFLRKPVSILIFGYLMGFILSIYIIQVGVYNLPFMGVTFWILRRTIPLMLLCVCQWKIINLRLKFPFLIAMISFLVGLSILYLMNTNFKHIFNFGWSYHASIQYSIFALVYFWGFSRKLKTDFEALTITLMLLTFVGFMYELPLHPQFLYHSAFPLFINDQIFLGLIVIYKMGIEAFCNIVVFISGGFWLVFSVFVYLMPYAPFILFMALTVRMPTLIFWIVPIMKMRGQ